MISEKVQISESFLVGAILAAVGGYMDVYTYIARWEVFANAQTGNILFFGINLAQGDFRKAFHYLVSILACISGAMVARAIKWNAWQKLFNWKQVVILVEIIVLFIVGFIKAGSADIIANLLVSFVSALQIESFRKIEGKAYATTICTGNLRSGAELLCDYFQLKEIHKLKAGMQFFGIILFFIIGAMISLNITGKMGEKAIILSCLGLVIVFVLLFQENGGNKNDSAF